MCVRERERERVRGAGACERETNEREGNGGEGNGREGNGGRTMDEYRDDKKTRVTTTTVP